MWGLIPVPLILKQRSSQSRSSCSEFSISDNKGATAGKTVESISFIETPTFEKSIKGSARPETRINAASIRDPRAKINQTGPIMSPVAIPGVAVLVAVRGSRSFNQPTCRFELIKLICQKKKTSILYQRVFQRIRSTF